MRGTVRPLVRAQGGQGITPACAGNSQRADGKPQMDKDHPRVCGEQLINAKYSLKEQGSPPRVRGTGERRQHLLRGHRITPACAGNRVILPDLEQVDRDHPRVCGEQVAARSL